MMMAGNISGLFEQRDIFQNLTADDSVLFCDGIFFGSQSGWLVQNRIRDTDLSYVVQMSCVFQIQNFFRTPVKFFCNQCSIFGNPMRMSASIFILCFNGESQGLHHLQRQTLRLLAFFKRALLSLDFHIMYITDGAKYRHKEQNDHTDTHKHTGNGHYEVDRQPFNDCRYHNSRQSDQGQSVKADRALFHTFIKGNKGTDKCDA